MPLQALPSAQLRRLCSQWSPPPLKTLLRFSDLKARGIARSWAQLARLQRTSGFPAGRMLSANIRCWDEAEVEIWWESRPTDNPRPLQGGAAHRVKDAKARAGE
jgi:hypothetical protein